jgi:hypothetical protein
MHAFLTCILIINVKKIKEKIENKNIQFKKLQKISRAN